MMTILSGYKNRNIIQSNAPDGGRILEDHANTPANPFMNGKGCYVDSIKNDLTSLDVNARIAKYCMEKRGFSTAIWSEDDMNFPLINVQ